jgi:hypothetical protein
MFQLNVHWPVAYQQELVRAAAGDELQKRLKEIMAGGAITPARKGLLVRLLGILFKL